MNDHFKFQQILGVRFFLGNAREAIENVDRDGGLVVVPSGPGMRTLDQDEEYRQALTGADLALTDSAFMVLIWNLMHFSRIPKLSGLKYLSTLLELSSLRSPGATFWVMPNEQSAAINRDFLLTRGIQLDDEQIYLAPKYGRPVEDPVLLARINDKKPRHLFMAVGGGVQEPLGFYLKRNLDYLPAIHCIGAAIGFLSGDQVSIPVCVDRVGLGWFWRILSHPRRFFPRYWEARHLAALIIRYRDRLPEIKRP
jgi:UDP-N-acetyl-D-mannosaminuronic acid transferase (WecB/TagA/CpsF family)